jgi:predicted transposase YbfD/YdcC
LMPVKANQPHLLEEVTHLFTDAALVAETGTQARTVSKGHGRLEVRQLWTSTALVGYSDWPGLAQALCLQREVTRLNTGEVRRERVYAVTSLAPEQADAQVLLALWRGHWGIENRLHWVRDVSCSEDRSAARVGGVAQGMAAVRNTAIGLLRAHGSATIAASRRALAHHADAALTLLGL